MLNSEFQTDLKSEISLEGSGEGKESEKKGGRMMGE